MRIATWLLPVLVVVTASCSACKKKKAPIDAPPPPPIDADISTGAGPGPRQIVEMGAPFSAEPDGAAGEPGLAVDRDGKALLTWIEKGKVHVRRWSGTEWDAIGTPPNEATGRASGKPSIAFEDSGSILVGWLELDKQDINVFQVARWKDNAWTPLGENGSGKQHVADPVLAVSPIGAVALWREPEKLNMDVVHVSVLDAAKGWQPLGEGGVLRVTPESTTRRAPALATSAAGVLVGWIEVAPAPVLHMRRWDAAASKWTDVPDPPEGADGDSTLALAFAPDGTITCSLSYNIDLRQIVTLAAGATEWTKIDVPEVSNGYVSGQHLVAAEDGRAVFTYPFGGRFAWWDGKVWFATPVGVMAPSPVVPAAATGPGGVIYVAWSAGPANAPAKVRVLEVKKQGLGEK